jgi:hypothetical protein
MTLKDLISWHTEELQRLERSGNASRDTLARSQADFAIARHREAVELLTVLDEAEPIPPPPGSTPQQP